MVGQRFQRLHGLSAALLFAAANACAQGLLVDGVPVEATLATGASREFTLQVSEPRFLRLTLDQKTAPFRLLLSGPMGALGEHASRDFSRIRAAWILDRPGSYRVRVELDPRMSRPGTCSITLDDFRAPQAGDRAVEEAYRFFWSGYRTYSPLQPFPGGNDALQTAINTLTAVGDVTGQANALLLLAELNRGAKRLESARAFTQAQALYRASGDQFGESRATLRLATDAEDWDPGVGPKILSRLEEPANDWYRARLLQELGNAHEYRDAGHFERPAQYQSQSVELYRSVGDRYGLAAALSRLGAIQVKSGLYDEAVAAYSEAADIWADLQAPLARTAAVGDLARVFSVFLLNKQKALDLYRQELELAERAGNASAMADVLGPIAEIYTQLGQHPDALDTLLRIQRLENERGHKGLNLGLELRIASAHQALGDLDGAAAIRRRLPEDFQRTMQPNASSLAWMTLGNLRRAARDGAGARTAMEEALRAERATKNRFNEGPMLARLADIAEDSGDLRRAIEYSEQAYPAAQRPGVFAPGVLSEYPQSLALRYFRAGETNKALESAQEALRLGSEVKDREIRARALVLMARCEKALGRFEDAAADVERALGEVESVRSQLQNQELRSSYFAQRYGMYDFYVDLLMQLHAARPRQGFAARALDVSERGRARLLLEMLQEGNADIRSGVDPELLHKKTTLERQLTAKVNVEAAVLSRKHTQPAADEAALQVRMVTAELHNVEADIRTKSPRYASLTQPSPLTAGEIQARLLDPHTVLLEYWLGEDRSFLWAVSSDSVAAWDLPSRDALAARARAYYELLTARSQKTLETPGQRQLRVEAADTKARSAGAELSRLLLGPVAEAIRGRRIVVVRGDMLQLVPFAALPDPGNPARPLVAGHEVVALPSASALSVLRQQTETRRRPPKLVAVVADPVFDAADPRLGASSARAAKPATLPAGLERSAEAARIMQNGHLSRLPSSRMEANAIVAAAPPGGAWKILDFDASRATATDPKLSEYRIVHFASHALLNSETPELSGIVLSLVNRSGAAQDGLLRLQDIYNLNLPADLVVLSACQTALGKDVHGEGLIGLTRAFFYAGTKRVVSSLWKVDDSATAHLMENFYRAMLRSGLSPSAALRQAEIQLSRQPLWSSPYYWAAFELQGEWQ